MAVLVSETPYKGTPESWIVGSLSTHGRVGFTSLSGVGDAAYLSGDAQGNIGSAHVLKDDLIVSVIFSWAEPPQYWGEARAQAVLRFVVEGLELEGY